MFPVKQPLRQCVNHHSQENVSDSLTSPTPPSSTQAATSPLLSASHAAHSSALDQSLSDRTPVSAHGSPARLPGKSTGSKNRRQPNESGGALQREKTPTPTTAAHRIVSGKFYSSSEYPTHYRPHVLSAQEHHNQQHSSANANSFGTTSSAPTPAGANQSTQGIAFGYKPSLVCAAAVPPSRRQSPLQDTPQNRHSASDRRGATVTTRSAMESTLYHPPNPGTTASPYPSRTSPTFGSPRMAAPNVPIAGFVRQPQQSYPTNQGFPPHGSSSPTHFFVSNTSVSGSSADNSGSRSFHQRLSHPSDAHGNHRQGTSVPQQQQQQQQHRHANTLQRPPERCNSGVMGTVSRSLNTHNDPELEGLQPMHQDNEDEDTLAGHTSDVVSGLAHPPTLCSKGFLISTTFSARNLPAPLSSKGSGTNITPHLTDDAERKRSGADDDVSSGQASQSRGPTASNPTGIAHRLLTLEEIDERRRTSWAASHPVSNAQLASGDNVGNHKKEGNSQRDSNTTTSNLGAVNSTNKGSRPPHRQLTKEEADQLIAQRQQRRAAETSTAAKDLSAQQQQQQHTLPLPSTHTTSNNNNNTQSVLLPPSSSGNAKPWLLSENGIQEHYFPAALGAEQEAESANSTGSGANTAARPMTFEWLRGTSGGSSGTGFFSEATLHGWPAVNPWRDTTVSVNSGCGGNANLNTTTTTHLCAAGNTPGEANSSGGLKTLATNQGATGQTLSGVSSTGLTWLPNNSCWSPHNQQQQQPFFSFAPPAPPPMDHVTSITNATAAAWGYGTTTTTLDLSGGNPQRHALTMALPPTSDATLRGLPREHIETRLQQCDVQLEKLRQEREKLMGELQRRIYAPTGGDQQQQNSNNNPNAANWPCTHSHNTLTTPLVVKHAATTAPVMPPLTTATTEAGSPTGPGVSVGHNPAWQLLGDLVDDSGAIKTPSWAALNSREPHAACTDTIVKIDGQEWASHPTRAVVGQAPLETIGSSDAGKGEGKNASHWSASERSGARGRCRSVHAISTECSHGNRSNIINTSSSLTGVGTTASKHAGGGQNTHTRCSHDNTPQEQKYLQTDPFSMYMHNKKIAMAHQATSGDVAKRDDAQHSTA